MELAPICLFVYNRPDHTKRVLHALKQNKLSDESILYIFSDGSPEKSSISEKERILNVRQIIRDEKWCKTVIIEEIDSNNGLVDSIIKGVSKVIQKHGKIIVLEDDIVVSEYFLQYMNDALVKYADIEKVKQISGFSYPISEIPKQHSCYFLPITSTWGWATWSSVWNEIDFECKAFNPKTLDTFLFNFYGSYNYSKLLKKQMVGGRAESWGIKFYFNVFIQNGLVLYPDISLVQNIGWDNSGNHKTYYKLYPSLDFIDKYKIDVFPDLKIKKEYINLNVTFLKRTNSRLAKVLKVIKNIF